MYNYLGVVLLGLFAFMVIPYDIQAETNESVFYGSADIVVYDESGNEMLTQTIHNRLTDQGETYIVQQIFRDNNSGPSSNDGGRISSICLTSFDISGKGETYTAILFDNDNTLDASALPCKQVNAVDNTTTQGMAVIGPIIFQVPQNAPVTSEIKGIGICRTNTADDFALCNTVGTLFAFVDTTDILNLQQDQTISVKYTFDITSDNT